MYRINEFLTPSERLEAMRLGGLKKLASMGMTPSDFNKQADASGALSLFGTALRTAVFIGAPLGVVWYALSSSMKNDSEKTKRLKAQLDHFNDVAAKSRQTISSVKAPAY